MSNEIQIDSETSQDLRKENRYRREELVFIEVLSSSAEQHDGLIVKCSTRDISATGLKVQSSYPLKVNSLLELLVEFKDDSSRFLLTGEVRWCDQIDDMPTYLCGFEIIEAEHSDIHSWRTQFP
ncbi:PilZ domain-containing protein [Pleionea sp. CnH1-48]|uniref:PilZ domain-containing protein n=1 Tax=Pleionea sp. CnH1-48 TaxID=2954494 RepID=UPI00209766C3|nr:PilZ domain-containing protein [Pleionea sp. CnH1-48]MCO7225318.1 PilZ domain-containing protein [Pleionea sp. CnH1-48]